jgi:hypothetical protein
VGASVAALALAFVAGCGTAETPTADAPAAPAAAAGSQAGAILDKLGLAGKDATQVVDALDQKTGERQRDIFASVRYDQLVLKDGGTETSLPISGDRFYLSVAPYVDQTHECFYHSLTTCRGELADQTVDVKIVDSAGKTLVDGPAKTYSNGFVGFWLPRDITGTITVSYDGRTATSAISTGKDAPTCLTTLKMV